MHNYRNGIGYMTYLKQKREAAQALRDATPKPLTLHERIDSWYNGLADDEKHRPWAMHEFKALFGNTPQKIGAALFELGWTRRRLWKDDRPTARYWNKK